MEAQNIRRSSSQFSAKNKKSVRLIENALTSDTNMWVVMTNSNYTYSVDNDT